MSEQTKFPSTPDAHPGCGWKTELKLTTNAPWNEKTLRKAVPHVWYHLWLRSTDLFKLNKIVVLTIIAYIIILIVAAIFNVLHLGQIIWALLPLISLMIGLGLREAVKEVRVESFQMWLRKVYAIDLNYVEAVLALTAFYHGVERYVIPAGGTLSRVDNGLIYTHNNGETNVW